MLGEVGCLRHFWLCYGQKLPLGKTAAAVRSVRMDGTKPCLRPKDPVERQWRLDWRSAQTSEFVPGVVDFKGIPRQG